MIADTKKHFNYFFPLEVNEEKILDINQIKFAPLYDESEISESMTFEEFKNINS